MLLAAIGQRTARIRLGSGGVMLPNHRPLVVAEQFLMLEALTPGRIDLGLGRSLGFTARSARRWGRTEASTEDFAAEVGQVRDLLEGHRALTARPSRRSPRRCTCSPPVPGSASPPGSASAWCSAGPSCVPTTWASASPPTGASSARTAAASRT